MAQGKYIVAEGKHDLGNGKYFKAGDPPMMMDEAEVAKFPNKFKAVMIPDPTPAAAVPAKAGEGEETEEDQIAAALANKQLTT